MDDKDIDVIDQTNLAIPHEFHNTDHTTPQTAQELTDAHNQVWQELFFTVTLNPLTNIGEGFGHS